MPSSLYEQIIAACAYIQQHIDAAPPPTIGIVLGTGLGQVLEAVTVETVIPYADIPHFPVSTVKSHEGKLLLGQWQGHRVVILSGRFHYYEGYSMQVVTFPIRVLHALGVRRLILTNAVGSIQEQIERGDMVFISDHINMQPENPLRGYNDERLGVRFPDMSQAYDIALNDKAMSCAQQLGIRAHTGVYVATQGPNLETPAEYNFFRLIGGDVVGMSTVPEVIVARHAGLPVFVVSVVSNKCYPIAQIGKTTLEEVIATVQQAAPLLRQLLDTLLRDMRP